MPIRHKYDNAMDAMAHAMDNSPPSTIIFITGDQDFTYLVSVLTLRQYHMFVVIPPNNHSSLMYQASAVLDWHTQILQQPNRPGSTNSSASESTVATPSNSVPQLPSQPFSFPNTFPAPSVT
jgi:hypothetical protein